MFAEAARALGRVMGARGLTLVYGGARVGLMGEVAEAALSAGAAVMGVIPASMVEREIADVSQVSSNTRSWRRSQRRDAS